MNRPEEGELDDSFFDICLVGLVAIFAIIGCIGGACIGAIIAAIVCSVEGMAYEQKNVAMALTALIVGLIGLIAGIVVAFKASRWKSNGL